MALVGIHADLLQTLESALDTTKILAVFSSLVTIVKDQQEKIDESDRMIREFASRGHIGYSGGETGGGSGDETDRRLRALEAQVDEMRLNLHGGENEDSSILHAKELTGYAAFETSSIGITAAKSFDVSEIQGGLVETAEAPAPIDALPPAESIQAEDNDVNPVSPETVSDAAPLSSRQQSRPATRPVTPAVAAAADEAHLAQVEVEEAHVEAEKAPQEEEEVASVPVDDQQPPAPSADEQTAETDPAVAPMPASAAPTPRSARDETPVESLADVAARSPSPAMPLDDNSAPKSARQLSARQASSVTVRQVTPGSRPKTPGQQQVDFALDEVEEIPPPEFSSPGMERIAFSERPFSGKPMELESARQLSSRARTPQPATSSSRPVTPGLAQAVYVDVGAKDIPAHMRRRSTGTMDQFAALPVKLNLEVFGKCRRKMDLANLPFLTKARRDRITKELRRRGTHLRISKEMLEDARKRYSNKSLKQKMEYIEVDVSRLRGNLVSLQMQVKRNAVALKERAGGERDDGIMNHIELLLRVVDDFGGVERLSHALHATEANTKMIHEITEDGFTSAAAMDKMKKDIAKEQNITLQEAIVRNSEEIRDDLTRALTSKVDVENMLSMPEAGKTTKGGGYTPLVSSKPGDKNNTRLVGMLNVAISTVHDRLDTFEKYMGRQLQDLADRQQEAMQTPDNTASSDYILMKAAQYTDEKIAHMARFVEQKVAELETKRNEIADEMTVIKMKLGAVEAKSAENKDTEDPEALRREATAIRELQRRVANIPVDKLLEEMKVVQKDIRARPLASEVAERITSTEDSLRGLLGENVVGLRSLLYEVFRHIQHKADRDDIRHLITAKLSQMEKEIVKREEDMLSAASMTRCLSCGQTPNSNAVVYHSNTVSKPSSAMVMVPTQKPSSPVLAQGGSIVLDDEISGEHPTGQYSSSQSEQVYSLLTGQAGLKSLHLQHTPMQPVRDPYHVPGQGQGSNDNHRSNAAANKPRPKTVDKIPDPLYRKARLSQHMKEMVKVSNTSLAAHGYDLGNNPLYVLDAHDNQRVANSAPLVATDHGSEPPLNNPFNDLAQPLSYSSLPRSAAQHIGKDLLNSRSTSSLSSKAARTAGNVMLPDIHVSGSSSAASGGGDFQVSSAKLHNSYL